MTELNGAWYDKNGKRAFANGGSAGFTGLAMLHGKPGDEETILNGSQSKALYSWVKSITNPNGTPNKLGGSNGSTQIFNIETINLPSVKNGNDFIKDLQLKTMNR
jgi:hypothetical protein